MQELSDKVAFISGGASGLGLALAEACGRAGLRVVIGDHRADVLPEAIAQLARCGVEAESLQVDVSRRTSVEAAAARILDRFGAVHLVCNNAGVGAAGRLGGAPPDWRRVIGTNIMGVVHGVEVFAPHMMAQRDGHFVNVASVVALAGVAGLEPYAATKAAVLSMSEGWAQQLAPHGVGVSVACPGPIATPLLDQAYAVAPDAAAALRDRPPAEPGAVAARILQGVRAGELYVFTHPEYRSWVASRLRALLVAFDRTAGGPRRTPPAFGPPS